MGEKASIKPPMALQRPSMVCSAALMLLEIFRQLQPPNQQFNGRAVVGAYASSCECTFSPLQQRETALEPLFPSRCCVHTLVFDEHFLACVSS